MKKRKIDRSCPVWEKSSPIVDMWVTLEAKAWIEAWLKPSHEGIEYGAGCSTAYLGQRVKHLTSIEHKLGWYRLIWKLLRENNVRNVQLIYEPEKTEYLEPLKWYKEQSLDFAFIDAWHWARANCAIMAWPRLKSGGILILDNAEIKKYKPAVVFLDKQETQDRFVFKGVGRNPWTREITGKEWWTSIWIKL